MFYPASLKCLPVSLVNLYPCVEERPPPHDQSVTKSSAVCHLTDKPILSFFYCNARSLISKLNALHSYISLYHPSVISITESWLNSSVPSSFVCPSGYNIYRQDRLHGRGGGVLILVQKEITSFPINIEDSLTNSSNVNATACQISLQDSYGTLGLLCIYRAPDSNCDDNQALLNVMSSFLSHNFDRSIIIGDFNHPDIVWSHSAASRQSSLFLNFCQENYLKQNICEPTRRASGNILDLVLTSVGTSISDISVNEEFASSDHAVIQFNLCLRPQNCKFERYARNLRTANWDHFQELLADIPQWKDILDMKDVDLVWSHFLSFLNGCLDQVAPLKKMSPRNCVSSPRVRTAFRRKRRCLHVLKANPNISTKLAYLRASLIAELRVKEDLISKEKRILDNPNPNAFWSYVNNRLKTSNQVDFIETDKTKITNPKKMSHIFNDYFGSIFGPDSNTSNALPSPTYDNASTLPTFAVRVGDVANIIRKLPNKRSLDPDGLSYFIIKKGGHAVILYLFQIFELSFELGRIPLSWKTAHVNPIHKKGSKGAVENYRPISVTSCCSRILEKIVKRSLTQHLLTNNLIHSSQHGFLPGCSTETILVTFYDKITSYLELNHIVDVIFFDFKKAFDTVPHDVLLSKLKACGIAHRALQWMSHFLLDRSQKVKIGDTLSDPVRVASGVIQGSVIGPVLFNLFINDIDLSIKHGHILKYADDIRIFLSCPKDHVNELHSKLQCDVSSISKWTTNNGMSLNVTKCFTVSFGKSTSPRIYSIDDVSIPQSTTYNDLGVIVQSPLSFKGHISSMIRKSFSKLGLIKKLFIKKDKTSITKLFDAFVLPTAEYASIIWCPSSTFQSDNVERIQKSMCRLIPSIRNLSYSEQLQSLGKFSLRIRRIRRQLIFMFKMLSGSLNLNFDEMFDRRLTCRTRGHNVQLTARFARRNCRLHFFSTHAIQYWNKLSPDIIDSSSLVVFKNKLNTFLSSTQFPDDML